MAIKIYKQICAGRRINSVTDYSVLTKNTRPMKSAIKAFGRTAGSNNQGKITTRHQGGGHKLKVRTLDFSRRDKMNIPAKVETLEYDPGRSAFITRLSYLDGEKRYILAPDGVKVGETILMAERTDVKTGNRMKLRNIPIGANVHDVEILGQGGGQMVRAAGPYA